jgi:hypothetical protein
MRNVIFQHAWFIRHFLSRFSSANNHLIGELTGLWTVCSLFDLGSRGRRWGAYAAKHLEKEAEKQVYPDGVDKEQAVYYHYWVLEYLLFSCLVGARTGRPFSQQFVERIGAMANFLDALIPAGGTAPQIGDADDGFVCRFSVRGDDQPFRDLLSACDLLLFGKQDVELTEKSFWYSAISGVCPGVCRPRSVDAQDLYPQVYAQGGYAILGDSNVHIVFDAGPLGYTSLAAHGHADALSFCLAIKGNWWLVDPGTYTYHDNADWRNFFRGTSAHNTVVVDGVNQSIIGGDFLWTEHASAKLTGHGRRDSLQWAEGSHYGYRRFGVTHSRYIGYEEKVRVLTISDTLNGDGTHDLCWHWHLSPDVDASWDASRNGWILQHRNCVETLLLSGGDAGGWELFKGSAQPVLGWYSPALGTRVPSVTLRYRSTDRLPLTAAFTIAFIETGSGH